MDKKETTFASTKLFTILQRLEHFLIEDGWKEVTDKISIVDLQFRQEDVYCVPGNSHIFYKVPWAWFHQPYLLVSEPSYIPINKYISIVSGDVLSRVLILESYFGINFKVIILAGPKDRVSNVIKEVLVFEPSTTESEIIDNFKMAFSYAMSNIEEPDDSINPPEFIDPF